MGRQLRASRRSWPISISRSTYTKQTTLHSALSCRQAGRQASERAGKQLASWEGMRQAIWPYPRAHKQSAQEPVDLLRRGHCHVPLHFLPKVYE